jgi:signal peptide peptidase SppA
MPAIPPHDTAVVDEPWDGPGAVAKLHAPLTGAVGKDEFAWYDSSAPDTDGDDGYPDAKNAWKFPHHEVDANGKPGAANVNGCQNALARVENSDIPDGDKAGVRRHVQHHLDAAKKPSGSSEWRGLNLALSRPLAISREALAEYRALLGALPQHLTTEVLAGTGRRTGVATRLDAGDTQLAVVPLRGAVTPRGSLLSILFGGTGGLQGFRESFREALADDNVSAILLDIDSPGGLIDLVPETAAEIRGARGTKPIVALANTLAASAAYWIATQADELVVTPSGQVGSVGVYTVHEDVSKMGQMMGIQTTIVSAGDHKVDGNPYEPLSKSALASLQEQVDDLYAMFVRDVAAGRNVGEGAVAAGYGQGRAVLADRAITLGMVDRVETFEQTVARLGAGTADEPAADAADLADAPEPDDDELAPQATQTVPETDSNSRSVSAPPRDYLDPALCEQPAWSL